VGDPFGDYVSYSYGANGNWLQGEVYVDIDHGGKIEKYKKTTPEQDKEFKEKLESEDRHKSIYGINDICRSYSQRKFNEAPGTKVTPPKRVKKPGPKKTIVSTTTRGTSSTETSTSR
jgi:hypothetical protein